MSSVFETFDGAICADFFGDDFGIPLPPTIKTEKEKAAAKAAHNAEKSTSDPPKPLLGGTKFVSKTPSFLPALDGLHCFETLGYH